MPDKNGHKIPLIALTGRPNVGKSTFFNRLTGSRKAIVDSTPGLTRDRRYGMAKWRDFKFALTDAGGLENISQADRQDNTLSGKSAIEAMVQRNSLLAIEEADMLLVIFDAETGITPDDYEVADIVRQAGKPFMAVVNKIDSENKEHLVYDFWQLGFDELFYMSAKNGFRVAEVMDRLTGRLEQMGFQSAEPNGREIDECW
jgi:GTP-binding protein